MDGNLMLFFAKMPGALPIYERFAEELHARFESYSVKIQKTQISFSNRYGFAYVSIPTLRVKDRPETYIVVTFGIGYKMEHPRIYVSTEPYPNRWTHHVIVRSEDEIDGELMGWIEESYHFSMAKR